MQLLRRRLLLLCVDPSAEFPPPALLQLVNTAWNLWMQEDEVVDDITVVAIKFNAI